MQIPLAFTGGKPGSPLKKKKRKQQNPKIQTPNTIVVVVQIKHKNPSLSPSTQSGEALELDPGMSPWFLCGRKAQALAMHKWALVGKDVAQ